MGKRFWLPLPCWVIVGVYGLGLVSGIDETRAQHDLESDRVESALVAVIGQREDGKHQTRGAGFFVGEKHVMTHHHLVSFERTALVRLAHDGSEFSADVVARDPFRN